MKIEVGCLERLVVERQAHSQGCIHEIFQKQAQKTPEAFALSFHGKRTTYRQLDEESNRLAHYLTGLGVRKETPVALYLERTPRMVVSILAVLKAGGAYVPIDLAYPPERLAFMLQDSQAPLLITEESLLAKLPKSVPRVICLDHDRETIARQPASLVAVKVHNQDAAYIIYTSGSTGQPKGVIVTHHNVVRLLKETEHWYGFNEKDVWPLFHSYAFDVSVWELWGCLFYGGRLVIVPYLVTRTPAEFYELLAREKVTVLNQTPSAFRQLIWAEGQATVQHKLCLRYVICAGEALELQSLKPWFDRHGDEKPQIVNKYGITETTVHSTYRVIRTSDLTNGMGSVIGVPIPDLRIHLLDDDLKPVPAGVPGEICVGGAGVARGYLNRPELTERRFIADPFSQAADARLYRSGDLAQVNANGEMEYLGRMDFQVKIRGFRVELGEIESALNRHSAIRESVVIAQDTNVGDKRLVAYVVPVNSTPTVTELRQHLMQKLPDYMVPAVFVLLKALPLTTNGKVDRRTLPSPDRARPVLKVEYSAPRSEKEQALVRIWSEVLEVDPVGINDNFFELGGDSIRSITVLSRAEAAGLCLTLQQVFDNPTIAQLAKCEAQPKPRPGTKSSEAFCLISDEDKSLLPDDIEDAYPIAALQLGMFFSNELNTASAMYHDVFSYRIKAGFDLEKLRIVLARLGQRHPLLRTSFHLAGFSQPLQAVHRITPIPLTVEDLRAQNEAQQDERLVKWIDLEKRRPFERAAAPLVRFHVQIRYDSCFQLIISFHHACLDGWSLAVVITEICQEYSALQRNEQPQLSAPRIGYRNFVELERESVSSTETRQFWSKKLEGAVAQKLPRWPTAIRQGGQEQKRGQEIALGADVLTGLKALAKEAGVPLKTVLLAAHQRVMGLMHGQNDVISGLICNGRPVEVDGERIVGLFLNNLPLRTRLGHGTWLELVQQTFDAEREIVAHRRFPIAEIKKLMGGEQLFETAFDFVHFHVYKQLQAGGGLDLAEGHYFEANSLTSYTTFLLDLDSSRLELHIDYDPNELCEEQIDHMNGYYIYTLRAMATEPGARYDLFSPLSQHERDQQLVTWNNTFQELPASTLIANLFEARARETPHAIALTCGSTTMSYQQLNERAENVSRALLDLGLVERELIGICVERSPEMVIGLLGILKAGGAYLPLDPAYPRERLEFMIQDSAIRLLLTQQPLLRALPSVSAKSVCIEDLLSAPPAPANAPPSNVRSPNGTPESPCLAYVIYTSGSTGKPKGVQINQCAVTNLLLSAAHTAQITAGDHLLAVTTLSFDIAALEIFMPLVTGGRLTLATRDQAADGSQLAALIASSAPTVMQATPATWRLLIEAGWTGDKRLKVFCGGEALRRDLADEISTRCKELWNFYGPTETTIWSSAWKVAPNESIVIGRPLANTQFCILDHEFRLLPVGTAGELHIGGAGLARGYLNRPDLTSERFISNPFSASNHERLYKTGDLARYRPDGNVECLGRLDHQVKIRGFRVELGEVETILRQHIGIGDAVVTARPDSLGEQRLVGYLISRNGPVPAAELREFARTRLPLYMIPSQFVFLKQFPLTPNGKVDFRSLPSPALAGEATINLVAPRSNSEQQLAGIWREVLMVSAIGIDDDFFDLGGDSLTATRAFARTNQAFGTALTLREMLDHPTIRGLSEMIATSNRVAPACPPLIPRRARSLARN